MKRPVLACLGMVLFGSMSWAAASSSSATPATQRQPSAAERWAAIARWPNFNEGVWSVNFGPGAAGVAGLVPGGGVRPVLTEAAKARIAGSKRPAEEVGGGNSNALEKCQPLGVPGVLNKPYPFEFVYAPDRITMLFEFDGQIRRIFMDGRPLPEDPDLTYGGTSIGRWDGDTLVVTSNGFLPNMSLIPGVPTDNSMTFVERMHLSGPDTLLIDVTVNAPGVLEKPYQYTKTYQRHRDWEIQEYFCVQNPRANVDTKGDVKPDLTPPTTPSK